MTVLTWLNAFPGIPFPNHLSGKAKPQSFIHPGAVQPYAVATVLTFANAFPGIPFPNHLPGKGKPQSYRLPGAVQPAPYVSPPWFSGVVLMPAVIRRFIMRPD